VKKPVFAFVAAITLVVATFACFGAPIFAQQKPVAPLPVSEPTLTEAQEQSLEIKFLKLEKAAQAASPEALAKAIADFITATQTAVQKANEEMGAAMQPLSKDGYDLRRDPQSGKFVYVKR
jgi:type II secretory pathway component PulM